MQCVRGAPQGEAWGWRVVREGQPENLDAQNLLFEDLPVEMTDSRMSLSFSGPQIGQQRES